VRADEGLYTAGDHFWNRPCTASRRDRFGTHAAQTTAEFMEYRSDGWKQAE